MGITNICNSAYIFAEFYETNVPELKPSFPSFAADPQILLDGPYLSVFNRLKIGQYFISISSIQFKSYSKKILFRRGEGSLNLCWMGEG